MSLKNRLQNSFCSWLVPMQIRNRFLLLGLCIGAAIRAGMLWFVDYKFDGGDSLYYLKTAHNLIEYQVFSREISVNPTPEFGRPPLYSVFIALVESIFGGNLLYVQLAQLAISLVTALLLTRIVALFAPWAVTSVFVLMMLSPFEAVYTGAILSETLTTFLLVASASAILTISSSKRWAVGGILFGLCILTRDIYWPMILIIPGCWILFGKVDIRLRCLESLIFVLATFLVVLPWTIRNYHVAGRIVGVSEGRFGQAIWMGTWATNGAFTENDAYGRVYPSQAFRSQAEKELVSNALETGKEGDAILRSLAIQRIFDEPVPVIGRYFARAPQLWFGTRFDIFQLNQVHFPRKSHSWVAVKIILWSINSILILLSIVGMVLTWRQRSHMMILFLPILYTAFIHFPLNSFEIRYSQPVYPFLLVFTGIALTNCISKLSLFGIKKRIRIHSGANFD
jgi:hypothetical protein